MVKRRGRKVREERARGGNAFSYASDMDNLFNQELFRRLHFLYSRDLNLLTLRDQKVEDLLYFL